ncbi:MAG: hypothetical protein KBS81_09145, partial [Spirochaetales bacterium]|nr:hypothetical protein [Candidatus Physcosoma equi]
TTTGQIAVQRTYTNKVVNKQTFEPTKIKFFSDYITSNMVVDCLYSMKSAIVDDFVPTQRSTYISLMANKPKLPVLETAYSAAKGGNLSYALDIFKNTYETSGHIAAGYNAAVILAAQNDIENALVVLSDIRSKAGANSKVNNLYGKLMTLKEKNDLALSQMTSSSGDAPDLSSKQSVLDYLLN